MSVCMTSYANEKQLNKRVAYTPKVAQISPVKTRELWCSCENERVLMFVSLVKTSEFWCSIQVVYETKSCISALPFLVTCTELFPVSKYECFLTLFAVQSLPNPFPNLVTQNHRQSWGLCVSYPFSPSKFLAVLRAVNMDWLSAMGAHVWLPNLSLWGFLWWIRMDYVQYKKSTSERCERNSYWRRCMDDNQMVDKS